MTRLLRVELRRLYARRLIGLTLVGTLLASALMIVGVWRTSQPMDAEDLRYAEEMYQEQLAYWEEHGEDEIASCREGEALEAEELGEPVDWACDSMTAPEREWFVHTAPPLEQSLPEVLALHSFLLLLAAVLVGATFSGAELSTGSITTWLSFEPRRGRVYASKLLAAGLGVLPVAALAIGVVVVGAALIADHFDLAGTMTSAHWGAVTWTAVRMLGLTFLAGLVGTALGFLLGHTGAVLGIGVVYLLGEQIFVSLVRGSAPWVLSTNISAWVRDGTTYYVELCTTDVTGTMCDYVERTVSLGRGAVYLLVLSAVVVGIGAMAFRNRDVD